MQKAEVMKYENQKEAKTGKLLIYLELNKLITWEKNQEVKGLK